MGFLSVTDLAGFVHLLVGEPDVSNAGQFFSPGRIGVARLCNFSTFLCRIVFITKLLLDRKKLQALPACDKSKLPKQNFVSVEDHIYWRGRAVSRLPWRRVAEGGFVAFPDGSNVPERCARIRPMASRSGAYSWAVAYDGANITGTADSAQEASDAANEAWGRVQAKALEQNAQAAEEARLSALIDAAMPTLDPDLKPFAIGTASRETLTWLITRASKKGQAPGRGKLVNALSIELYKFRTGERSE